MSKGGKARIELDRKGIDMLLKSQEVADLTRKYGNRLAGTAESQTGGKAEFDVRTFRGRDRARTHVGTANAEAMRAEAKSRALTRAAYRLGD